MIITGSLFYASIYRDIFPFLYPRPKKDNKIKLKQLKQIKKKKKCSKKKSRMYIKNLEVSYKATFPLELLLSLPRWSVFKWRLEKKGFWGHWGTVSDSLRILFPILSGYLDCCVRDLFWRFFDGLWGFFFVIVVWNLSTVCGSFKTMFSISFSDSIRLLNRMASVKFRYCLVIFSVILMS